MNETKKGFVFVTFFVSTAAFLFTVRTIIVVVFLVLFVVGKAFVF